MQRQVRNPGGLVSMGRLLVNRANRKIQEGLLIIIQSHPRLIAQFAIFKPESGIFWHLSETNRLDFPFEVSYFPSQK
jgi:hypothetical protein